MPIAFAIEESPQLGDGDHSFDFVPQGEDASDY
jgi:hypothetical protein